MRNIKDTIINIVVGIIVVTLIVLGFVFSSWLNDIQIETLIILAIICGCAAFYCFIVGEISRNNSQMDKLWSILPIVYVWVIAIKGWFNLRLFVIAIIVTLWGIRLTFNFARKGAYSIKFWAGEEDYRWVVLRQKKILKHKPVWALFNLGFISIYQNALVLAICLPALACMSSTTPFGVFDHLAAVAAILFLVLETVADEQQWAFHKTKKMYAAQGLRLEDYPAPYNKGFNTTGIWKYARHPNYLGEQGIWVSIYFFVVGAGIANYGIFNWTLVGSMLLILLFMGSSAFGEGVSASKYSEYPLYQKEVSKYFPNPFRRYKR